MFRNPEDRTRVIVLNILKTGNQGLCAAKKGESYCRGYSSQDVKG